MAEIYNMADFPKNKDRDHLSLQEIMLNLHIATLQYHLNLMQIAYPMLDIQLYAGLGATDENV